MTNILKYHPVFNSSQIIENTLKGDNNITIVFV